MNSYDPEQLRELHMACIAAKGSKARGDALEDFVEHVFLQVPSVKLYERDVKDENGEQRGRLNLHASEQYLSITDP